MSDTTNTLKVNGMKVEPPSAQLRADMQKVGATLLEEWLKNAGAEGQEMINAFRR
jgi:TRAP-type C4-dicarboxylate transport system substrate-binding protein